MRMLPGIGSFLIGVVILALPGCGADTPPASTPATPAAISAPPGERLTLTDAQWKQRLTLEQYQVLRGHGTEAPFGPVYYRIEKNGPGTYICAGCGETLFTSDALFTSGTGWPSFVRPIAGHVEPTEDTSHGMVRSEVHCVHCGGHLGHVFDDGPQPTGLRYCIDGVALAFVPASPAAPSPAVPAKP